MIKFHQLDNRTYIVRGLPHNLEMRQRAATNDFVMYYYHQPDHRWFPVATYPTLGVARADLELKTDPDDEIGLDLLPQILYNSEPILTEDYYASC